jgi:hypothetical protein
MEEFCTIGYSESYQKMQKQARKLPGLFIVTVTDPETI